MWLLVYCNESKTCSVINSADLPDEQLQVGSTVNMIRSAEVLFMSPNKAICERQCGVLKKTPSLYKGIISRPHLLQSESAKQDAVESKLDRIIAYLTGFELRLQKIADRQMKMERDLASLTGAAPVFERYTPSESSSPDQPQKLDVRDRSVATPRPRKGGSFPYIFLSSSYFRCF